MTQFFNNQTQVELKNYDNFNPITRITGNYYRVRSQSSDKIYNVRKLPDVAIWTCECHGFLYRLNQKDDKRCSHILACQQLDRITGQEKIERVGRSRICPKCYSTTIVKNGYRNIRNGLKRQRYCCKQCNYKFILGENGFSKISSDPKTITESLNLYLSGMSLRNIARHIEITRNQKISHASIYNWFTKYMTIIKEYVDSILPQPSNVWSLDEMMINVKKTKPISGKGFYDWLWTIIDPQTKFVIATEVSKRREVLDARKIIAKGKEIARPSYVITDSLRTYERAIRKELDQRKTAHIKTKSLEDGFENRPIERYHNEVRSVIKSKRGLGNDKSTQEFADAYRIYHNFVRPHTGLEDNITPAEASGLDLELGNDKIKDLITKSVEAKENNFAIQLGMRIDKVNIVNNNGDIKVIPKGWIEKKIWREINDILRLNKFCWLKNGKDGCWIRLKQSLIEYI